MRLKEFLDAVKDAAGSLEAETGRKDPLVTILNKDDTNEVDVLKISHDKLGVTIFADF